MEQKSRWGTWWLKSESKPEWNANGQDYVGGFEICSGAREILERKRQELREEPPEDLEWGYIRD